MVATSPARRTRLDRSEKPLEEVHEANEENENKHSNRHRSLSSDMILRHVPYSDQLIAGYHKIPPKLRLLVFMVWLLWKVSIVLLFMKIVWAGLWSSTSSSQQQQQRPQYSTNSKQDRQTRILYIVTSLAEYNNGSRQTIKGQDRLGEVLIPVLVDSVSSLVSYNYHVDIQLILGYELREERRLEIQSRLLNNNNNGVVQLLDIWDNAIPLGYPDDTKPHTKMVPNTRALSRQHRFVIKDKLHLYDLFCVWEDDMRITGMHVHHFLQMSAELQRLYQDAPSSDESAAAAAAAAAAAPVATEDVDPNQETFFGIMTKRQMKRLIPGFVRVEVLKANSTPASPSSVSTEPIIPLDYNFDGVGESHFDPSICCHVPNMEQPNPHSQNPMLSPKAEDVVVWETNVTALSLRELPGDSSMLDWVVLLPGPGKRLEPEDLIGGYWSGRDGAFGDLEKPSPGQPRLIAQQGGWMATREQIIQLNSGLCQGSFLPPFETPYYPGDGHVRKNVEFWSGGYQLFTGVRAGCNMQRLISFHPDHFSKHFIYHVANNKQKQMNRNRLVKADHLFAQLNTVLKAAQRTKARIMNKES